MDDLISRKAAHEAFRGKGKMHYENTDEGFKETMRAVERWIHEQIDSVPSADDCDGCRYQDRGPSDDPCYECRRNYYDRYEEEVEEKEEEDEDAFW